MIRVGVSLQARLVNLITDATPKKEYRTQKAKATYTRPALMYSKC